MSTTDEIYNLFYLTVSSENSFPRITEVEQLFQNITEDEFVELTQRIIASKDNDMTQQLLYFIILFRKMKHIHDYINSGRVEITLIEHLVMFSYSYCMLYDYSLERVIDDMLSFVNNDRLLTLVHESELIYNDKLLLFFILSKFQVEMLDKFFATIKDIPTFVNYFITLPEDILRSIVSRNYRLFQYIMIMMAEGDQESAVDSNFYNKYKTDIEVFSKLNDLIRSYRTATDPAKCVPAMNKKYSPQRIAYLVSMLRASSDLKRAIEYFDGENIYKDEKEKTIVAAILTDPFLKNIYKNEELPEVN
ncbi:MAG: hypothetical protein LBT84_00465 [Spirochaetia bacterium]|jgi:hypothetical protein|nr:hypothetical protein [Spirochaetia bacterium]